MILVQADPGGPGGFGDPFGPGGPGDFGDPFGGPGGPGGFFGGPGGPGDFGDPFGGPGGPGGFGGPGGPGGFWRSIWSQVVLVDLVDQAVQEILEIHLADRKVLILLHLHH